MWLMQSDLHFIAMHVLADRISVWTLEMYTHREYDQMTLSLPYGTNWRIMKGVNYIIWVTTHAEASCVD